MMNEHVDSIMTKNPISVKAGESLTEVLNIFRETRIHHLPVINNENDLLGIITTYDLWRLDLSFDAYPATSVHQVMTTKLAKISPTDKVGTAAELFLDKRIHALPVVENGKLKGIVTSFDVLRYEFIKEYDKPILYKEIYEQGINIAV